MKRNAFSMGVVAAALAAAFGVARADTITSATDPGGRFEPKCMDTANTQPAGCVPSAPIGRHSSSSSSSSSTDVNLSGSAAKQYPGGASSSSSSSLDAKTPASSTSSTLDVNPGVGVDANAGLGKPDTGTSSTQ